MMDIELLRSLLSCHPETGELTWKARTATMFPSAYAANAWNARYAGRPAFTTDGATGYKTGHIFQKTYMAHRVVWALSNGVWPAHEIDHINGTRWDNRLSNLRDATRAQQQRNVKQRKDNTTGAKGVDYKAGIGKWRARINHGGRRIHLGAFASLGAAIAARKVAERECGYHANHGRIG
jgi:hypothetical protein